MQRVFVGDVQGCSDELQELVGRLRAELGDAFVLHLVGDLVNRGPGNLATLRLVRDLEASGRARMVLGNHDLALVQVAAGLQEPGPRDTTRDVLEAPDLDDWVAWLRRQPLLVSGRLGVQRFGLVHAAAHPEWSLDELEARVRRVEARLADPDERGWREFLASAPEPGSDRELLARITHCRSVDAAGGWSSQPPDVAPAGFRAWHAGWSRRPTAFGVVYGHWSLQGLHVEPSLRGLDTGCVHHGRGRDGALTAWLPDEDSETPFDVPDERFWAVPARRVYYGDPVDERA